MNKQLMESCKERWEREIWKSWKKVIYFNIPNTESREGTSHLKGGKLPRGMELLWADVCVFVRVGASPIALLFWRLMQQGRFLAIFYFQPRGGERQLPHPFSAQIEVHCCQRIGSASRCNRLLPRQFTTYVKWIVPPQNIHKFKEKMYNHLSREVIVLLLAFSLDLLIITHTNWQSKSGLEKKEKSILNE